MQKLYNILKCWSSFVELTLTSNILLVYHIQVQKRVAIFHIYYIIRYFFLSLFVFLCRVPTRATFTITFPIKAVIYRYIQFHRQFKINDVRERVLNRYHYQLHLINNGIHHYKHSKKNIILVHTFQNRITGTIRITYHNAIIPIYIVYYITVYLLYSNKLVIKFWPSNYVGILDCL